MLKRWLVLLLVVALGSPQRGGAQGTVDTDLANGVRQAQEGDFENAVVTLDGVVRRLTGQPSRAKDLARAYTYLSIAYLGLSQEQTAKAKFLEAWKTDSDMNLSPREFPPRVLEFFEKARAGGEPARAHDRDARSTARGRRGRAEEGFQDGPHPHRRRRARRGGGRGRGGRRGERQRRHSRDHAAERPASPSG